MAEMMELAEKERLGMVTAMGSTDRIRRLSHKSYTTPQSICLHRARAYTEVFAETEGEPIELRRAKGFKRALETVPVLIEEDELVVGNRACRIRSVPVIPECHGAWLQWDLEKLPTREQDSFEVPPEQMKEAKELLAFWKGKTIFDEWAATVPGNMADKLLGTGWADIACGVFFLGYHFTPPWEKIVNGGIKAFEDEVDARLDSLDYLKNPQDMGKEVILKAFKTIIEGIKIFAARYAEKARELAATEKNATRKQELLRIAENCDRVPYYPARNYYEAIQSVWFVHTLMHVEGTGPVYTLGRFDQYMYPFYKADLESGAITKEEAVELLENFYINCNNNLFLYDTQSAYNSAGFTQYQVISLGGVDETGKDASNVITYLCLDAAKTLRTVQPDLSLLCHPRETPYELKMKAAELVREGLGLPKFHSTETIKTGLMSLGYTLEEARMGWVRGCSELYGPGSKQYGHTAGAFVNITMALEAALFNGIKQVKGQKWSGEQIGLATGNAEDFSSYEELVDALKAQLTFMLQESHIGGSYMELAQKNFPQLLQSLFTDDCIGSCLPANAGGAKINVGPGLAICSGWATIADSLAAIKKLVFEEKRITMHELLEALQADFEGYGAIQKMLLNNAPKFGNDIDYVDDIARDIFKHVHDEGRKLVGINGNINSVGTDISVSHIIFGSFIGATPDGRNAGKALSDNVGPSDQRDVNGPVAHINSVTKMPIEREFGSIHNIYLTNIDTEDKMHDMIHLVDTYHMRGGHHLQINCIDKNVLLDAQKTPEKYPSLIVRVAGYCAYFNDLSKYVQDYIISRTSVNF